MKDQGFSLPELLVGLLLSTFIMAGLFHVYMGSKRQYQESQKNLQDAFDIQWVSHLMIDSIHQAGFTPCMKMDSLKFSDRRDTHSQQSEAMKIDRSPEIALTIRRMDTQFERILEIQNRMQLLVTQTQSLSSYQPLIISDCVHGEIHEIEEIIPVGKHQIVILKKPLIFDYPDRGWIGEWVEEKWFIKKQTQSLYYQRGRAGEIASNIQSLEFKKHSDRLEVILGLDTGKTYSLIAGLRNA